MGPTAGVALLPPGAAEVFDLDPGLPGAGVAADGKGAASGPGVHDGIGRQFAGDEHDVNGYRACAEVGRDLAADPAGFLRSSVECARVPGAGLRSDHVRVPFPAGTPAGPGLATRPGMQS